ncbi:MAG TPA: class I SAM-dependent RNA methyltransferase [Verrucomicrobiae bacterium]|nr:class I SAM-dependent RNA methyltransferase [Verrucomicrobiae bacterium]
MSLKIGDKLTLTIHDIAFGGEGVGRVDDFVVFVPFVIVRETVEVEITEVKKNFARAKLLRVEKSSPERVAPECRYFGACGGCQYQHIAYATQLRLKHKQISDMFERVGKIPADKIAPVIPSPQPYGYRNRIMIRSQWNGPAKKLVIGFIRADNNFVEDIEECKIAEPAISEQIKQVRANPPPKGGIKIVLRIPPENWDVPPDSFFQNNFFLLPKLVETVRGFLRDGGAKHLVDLYCGVGFFGIELADLVESFVGVEYDRLAINSARKNIASRKISNGEFVSATVEEVLPELLKKFSPEKTSVILDPPRKGCWPETLRLLRETKPAQVIYVSCHPATMARDLNILCAEGVFELAHVQPLDMFPQTQHVECVADLRAGQNLAKPPEIVSTE